MPLNLANVTPVKAAEMFNSGASGAPLEIGDQLILGGLTPNTNGCVYYPTFTLSDGGPGIAEVACVIKDRFNLAPGATSGPAAQQFDVWFEIEKKDGAYYQLGAAGTPVGTILDSTFADGRFGSTLNPNSPNMLPKIKLRTTTAGAASIKISRFNIGGTAATGTLTAGDLVVIAYGPWSFGGLHRFGCLPVDFD